MRRTSAGLQVVTTLAVFSAAVAFADHLTGQVADDAIRGCERNVADRRLDRDEALSDGRHRAALDYEKRIPRRFRVTPTGRDLPEFDCRAEYER